MEKKKNFLIFIFLVCNYNTALKKEKKKKPQSDENPNQTENLTKCLRGVLHEDHLIIGMYSLF